MGTKKFQEINPVHYEQAVKSIQTGDLLLCSGTYLISEFIKKASNSFISHVAFLFKWHNRTLVFESVEGTGVRIIPLLQYVSNYENTGKKYKGSLYIARHEQLISSSFDRSLLKNMMGKAIDLLNQDYNQAELIKILTRIKLGIGRHEDNDQYICSEFVDQCFQQIGISFPRDEGGFIYPEHIAADSSVYPMFELAA
ncbi:YiiX/YebB-like N1pC/P60 family cysteine hydrolase [Domibacillus indicus]|uniref:YiiX/YebB-like N1pC/P60 family cysteine hydrolase n=1 Tax=Domibacillus indicus TaxID=1437523 RepID=UPI000617D874|nr:YiiX/YebB-like N1pC/P60 family cysteine hydrolase [Domibacillus indicus]